MKLCFILGCKVNINYESYIPFYVENIQRYYPTADIILVDNNSSYKEFFDQFKDNKQITVLENTSEQKFPLGAFNFAARYIYEKSLVYDYCICTQDTFVLLNKFDFQILRDNNVEACPLAHILSVDGVPEHYDVLKSIGLYIPNDSYGGAWCTSWVCTSTALKKIYDYTHKIKVTTNWDSQVCERYMGKVLKHLNNNRDFSIEGNNSAIDRIYTVATVSVKDPESKKKCVAFLKKSQAKTEVVV